MTIRLRQCDKPRSEPSRTPSAPERLAPGQLGMRLGGGRHGEADPCVFAPGPKPGRDRELPARTASRHRSDEILVDGDVVEIAEAVLQALESGQKILAPLRRALAREQVGEELRSVAQLLRLDTQLVASAHVELRQRLAPLADLAPAPLQLRNGGSFDRQVAAIAHEIVLRLEPLAGLQPCRDVDRQRTKSG